MRLADRLSRGVLPSVVSQSVIENFQHGGCSGPLRGINYDINTDNLFNLHLS